MQVHPANRLAPFCVGLALLLCTRWAHAYRPFDGTDADVAEVGVYEVEIGPAGYLREGRDRFGVLPWTIHNVGIAHGHELVLEGRHLLSLDDAPPQGERSRVVGTGFFLKSILRRGSMQEGAGLSIASELGPLLPEWHGEKGMGASFAVIASQRFEAVTFHLNVAHVLDRSKSYALFVGGIAEGPHSWRVRPVAELFLERTFGGSQLRDGLVRSALLGAIWRVRDTFSFDVGGRIFREGDRDGLELRLGMTLAWSVSGS